MTKTTFAYINDLFAAESPLPEHLARTKAIKVVAGFRWTDQTATVKAQNSLKTERLAVYKNFLRQRDSLKKQLEVSGVNALAFVPTKAWTDICKQSKLLMLFPNKEGKILFSNNLVTEARSHSNVIFNWLSGLFIGFGMLLPTFLNALFSTYHPWGHLFYQWSTGEIVGFAVAMFIAGLLSMLGLMIVTCPFSGNNSDFGWLKERITARALRKWIADPAWLSRYLVPVPTDIWRGVCVPIHLPIPPDEVIEVLKRAENFPLSIAAVPEAVSFLGAEHILLEENDRQAKEEAIELQRVRALRQDPIVTTQIQGVVAVIAQFGDFPIEKEVVDQVSKTDYLA